MHRYPTCTSLAYLTPTRPRSHRAGQPSSSSHPPAAVPRSGCHCQTTLLGLCIRLVLDLYNPRLRVVSSSCSHLHALGLFVLNCLPDGVFRADRTLNTEQLTREPSPSSRQSHSILPSGATRSPPPPTSRTIPPHPASPATSDVPTCTEVPERQQQPGRA